jgi:hypothetical protein
MTRRPRENATSLSSRTKFCSSHPRFVAYIPRRRSAIRRQVLDCRPAGRVLFLDDNRRRRPGHVRPFKALDLMTMRSKFPFDALIIPSFDSLVWAEPLGVCICFRLLKAGIPIYSVEHCLWSVSDEGRPQLLDVIADRLRFQIQIPLSPEEVADANLDLDNLDNAFWRRMEQILNAMSTARDLKPDRAWRARCRAYRSDNSDPEEPSHG